MSTIKKIAKNSIFLLISQIFIYLFAFIYTIFSARYLGVEGFGVLSFALAFAGIFSVVGDLGLSTLTTREVARNKSLSNKYLVNISLIKTILVLLMFILIFISINLLNYPKQTIYIVYIISLSIIVGNYTMIFSSIFQAHEKMEYQAFSQAMVSILILIGILFAIEKNFDIIYFALIYLISNIIALVYNVFVYFWKFNTGILEIDIQFWKKTIIKAIPLSLAVIFSAIAFRIDSVMLSVIVNNISVGWYTASYKLMEALLFIPMVFSIAILPVFSKFYISSRESLKTSYELSFKYLNLIGIPIAFGTTLLANKIVLFIYGTEFTQSILALQILIWAIPFIFLSYVFKVILVSINKQDLLLKTILISMILNIVLNLILIPTYSYLGASLVTVLTELVSFSLCFYYLTIFVSKIPILKYTLKPVLASILMILLILNLKMNLFVVIIFASLFYFIILILLRTFSQEDISLIKEIIKKEK
jgi:O-antigen/teichoic acid export membrane protein